MKRFLNSKRNKVSSRTIFARVKRLFMLFYLIFCFCLGLPLLIFVIYMSTTHEKDVVDTTIRWAAADVRAEINIAEDTTRTTAEYVTKRIGTGRPLASYFMTNVDTLAGIDDAVANSVLGMDAALGVILRLEEEKYEEVYTYTAFHSAYTNDFKQDFIVEKVADSVVPRWYEKAVRLNRISYESINLGDGSGSNIIIAYPVINNKGETTGALGMVISPDVIRDISNEVPFYNNAIGFLVDPRGRVYCHKDYEDGVILSDIKYIVEKSKNNSKEDISFRYRGSNWVVKTISASSSLDYVLMIPQFEIIAGKYRNPIILLLSILILAIISFSISNLMLRTSFKPYELIINSVKNGMEGTVQLGLNTEKGDRELKLLNGRQDEIGDLARSITYITKRNSGIMESLADNNRQLMQANTEAHSARVDAENASRAKSDFLARMSHEIRTPMNAIVGMAEMLLRDNLSEKGREYVASIRTSSDNLLKIINDILDFSKIEAGNMEIVNEPYELVKVLSDATGALDFKAREKSLSLILDIDSSLPTALKGDDGHLKQVLINLISNAVKYTEKGNVTLLVNGTRTGDRINIHFSVKDTGIGIKESDIGKLYDSFSRFDIEKNHKVEGTGLGLSITKRLIDLLGGSLTVSSKYGCGSEFSFTLEQEIVDDTPMGDFERAKTQNLNSVVAYTSKLKVPGAKVLVVDDIKVNLVVAKGLLSEFELKCDTALSGQECLDVLKNDKSYDIVFLDHMMPEMDGVECFAKIREMEDEYYKKVPIVVLTANAVVGMKKEFEAVGFNDFISKPIEMGEMERILRSWLPSEKINNENSREESVMSEFGKVIPGIDMEEGLKLVGDSMEILEMVMETYVEEGEKTKNDIRNAFDNGDIKNYTVYTHGLKSASRSIGATALGDHAFEHEKMGKEENVDGIAADIDSLLAEFDEVLNNVTEYLKSKGIL